MEERDPVPSDVPTSDPESTSSPASARTAAAEPERSRRYLWALVALGAVLVLGSVWSAVRGPQHSGRRTATGAGSAQATSSAGVSGAATATITAGDVRAVLGSIDYAEATMTPVAAYDTAVAHMVTGIDMAAFAQATLNATTTISFWDVSAEHPRQVMGAEKDALVAEAVAYWIKAAAISGEATRSLADTLSVHEYPPLVADRNRTDGLSEVMGQGLEPLGLMFGARGGANGWTWQVAAVSVTGTDAADVTYTVSTDPGAGWTLADPAARFTKKLRFSYGADGRWRLSAWPNYSAVSQQLRSEVTPAGVVPRVDRWWKAL